MNGPDLEAMKQWAESRECSMEIAKAIFDIADGDDDAHRIWEAPTPDEIAKVEAQAWAYCKNGEQVLHWGVEKITRA